MRTKATGLCAKSRRAVNGGVFREKKYLKILNRVLESTFCEDWDKIGSNRAKKGHLLLKSTIFSKFAECQWVD